MIDTHAHLDFKQFEEDRKDVVVRFFDNGGQAILNVGVDKKRIAKTLEIVESYSKIFAIIGFHPSECEKVELGEVEKYLKEKCQHPKVRAIGEIGLDYFYINQEDNKKLQKKLFIKQLEIAKEFDLPVVIHCREAYGDLLKIISQAEFEGMSLVVHCFSGNLKEAERFLKFSNLKFSFTGNITFVKEGDELLKVVNKIPLDRIMAETDCPFLAPVPNRGKRNEPVYVKFVIEKIAEVKRMSFDVAEKIIDENAVDFFNLL